MLIIFKMALFDSDGNVESSSVSQLDIVPSVPVPVRATETLPRLPVHDYRKKRIKYLSHAETDPSSVDSGASQHHQLPLTSEWLFIRSNPKYEVETPEKLHRDAAISSGSRVGFTKRSNNNVASAASPNKNSKITLHLPKKQGMVSSKAAHELAWPAVDHNGVVPADDGSDIMPLIGIEVPRFWLPAEGTDYNTVGSMVNGEETIFLMIASYRDFQCRETIASAFDRADHPERLFVAAVDQTVPGDVGCLDVEIPCSTNPNQALCKYRDQIAVYKMDAQYATGPVTARHIGDRMYRGEYFVMQMDAHCYFIRHWDTLLIEQWRSTGNEMAVLR